MGSMSCTGWGAVTEKVTGRVIRLEERRSGRPCGFTVGGSAYGSGWTADGGWAGLALTGRVPLNPLADAVVHRKQPDPVSTSPWRLCLRTPPGRVGTDVRLRHEQRDANIICKLPLHMYVYGMADRSMFEMTGPALEALAHPVRARLMRTLGVEGPGTATALARRIGESSGLDSACASWRTSA